MVFQSFNLFSNVTVIENIMKPQMDKLSRTKQEAYDKAAELLKSVGLFGWRFAYPDELSGGQKQRVAIARVLAMDTENHISLAIVRNNVSQLSHEVPDGADGFTNLLTAAVRM